jgi:hypothetical protein
MMIFPLADGFRFFVDFWRKIAPSRDIVSLILGASIPFTATPIQHRVPRPCVFSDDETVQIRKMVSELLEMDAIVPV